MWINPSCPGGENADRKKWVLRTISGRKLRVEIKGGGRESNSLALGNNTWTHVSVTFPENATILNDLTFYINGAASTEGAGYNYLPDTSSVANLVIGNDFQNRRLAGLLDEIRSPQSSALQTGSRRSTTTKRAPKA